MVLLLFHNAGSLQLSSKVENILARILADNGIAFQMA